MARRWTQYLQLHGYKGTHEAQLDPIRSEYPLNPGSGFVVKASDASMNLILSVPSGKTVQIKYMYFNAATAGSIVFYDGGSVAGGSTTVFVAQFGSALFSAGAAHFWEIHPYGLYIQSLLWASMGAASTTGIKVGGYIFDLSASP